MNVEELVNLVNHLEGSPLNKFTRLVRDQLIGVERLAMYDEDNKDDILDLIEFIKKSQYSSTRPTESELVLYEELSNLLLTLLDKAACRKLTLENELKSINLSPVEINNKQVELIIVESDLEFSICGCGVVCIAYNPTYIIKRMELYLNGEVSGNEFIAYLKIIQSALTNCIVKSTFKDPNCKEALDRFLYYFSAKASKAIKEIDKCIESIIDEESNLTPSIIKGIYALEV